MGRQGVINGCCKDKNRIERRDKESEDRDMERSDKRVMENRGWEQG